VVDDPALVIDHVLDTEVDVWREATVELDLSVTHLFTQCRCAEIDEGEVHRLLPLVRELAFERDRRDVGFEDFGLRA
jgi:hypothetical protein